MVASIAMLSSGCGRLPVTLAMHDPIYPAKNQSVRYTLEQISGAWISSVDLYETVLTIDANGTATPNGPETLLKSWRSPTFPIDFSKPVGYGDNSVVRYRFLVKSWWGLWPWLRPYAHEVTFATRPYPFPQEAAPVYAVGDPNTAFDIVMIPDTDLVSETDMDAFRSNCRGMIRDAFLDEPTLRLFQRSFNFYINPYPGTATDSTSPALHSAPANWAFIDAFEGHVLMHKGELQDYWSEDVRLFSTEMSNRGTMLHEAGHALFKLKDEWAGGSHDKITPFPNNWSVKSEAVEYAPTVGKSASDASQIGPYDPWWKLCAKECQMNNWGLTHTTYDRPCRRRIIWSALTEIAP